MTLRFGIIHLSVFGSAARGELRTGSDVDLMVEFDSSAHVGLMKFGD